uniref:Uncharacterized protein n=1 Tax=Aegilops tauschii subsp. strangulata TaxID=200361 RepID=A0A452YZ31_AEGTS
MGMCCLLFLPVLGVWNCEILRSLSLIQIDLLHVHGERLKPNFIFSIGVSIPFIFIYVVIWMHSLHIFFILYLFFLLTVEVRKQSSCSVHLVNRTDEYVAFKVGMQFVLTFKFMCGLFVIMVTCTNMLDICRLAFALSVA